MKTSAFNFILILALIHFVRSHVYTQDFKSHLKNGTIVEKVSGFPYATYEQWLNACRGQYSFDESKFKKKFPPENFEEYRKEINCPFDTYEQWIQALRRRFNRSSFSEMAFRKKFPQEEFKKYKDEIDYIKIMYMSGGLRVEGFILKPKKTPGKKLPAIIYNRGGNRNLGLIDFEKLYDYFDLVCKGYVIVASQYRGCGRSEGQDEIGGSDVNDVLNLIPLIESLEYADASRIGMFGWSRGGMMSYIVLARTERISAAVIVAAPTDFYNEIRIRPETERLFLELVPTYRENKDRVLQSRSASYWPEKLHKRTPILLLQGSRDQRTDPTEVLRMAELLHESKHTFRFVFFENGDHGLNQHKNEVVELITDWFNKYVRGSISGPS